MVQVKDVVHEKSVRKTFARIGDFIDIPNLIKVQKDSYDWFINEGLGEVLRDISPIMQWRKRQNILWKKPKKEMQLIQQDCM